MLSFDAFADRLRDAGFAGAIESGPATTAVYGTDNSIYQLRPVGAVVPTSIDDLATLARLNHELDEPHPLVARGGGTGTNGQSLTDGVVVDTRRAMNRVVSIDVDGRRAVVEPGVVLDELNAHVRPHGLQFAPHTSTATRCTVGGMVATDAAGKGSLVHGRTNDHVLAIEAVLADGTICRFEAGGSTAPAPLSDELSTIIEGVDPADFPALPRGFTGYNLADACAGGLDVTKLLCGSEGTLALLGRITVHLTPLDDALRLAVVVLPSFADAVRESGRLTSTRPIAIECLDERTISLAAASPAWPALDALVHVGDGALLLLEYDGDDGIERLRVALGASSSSVDMGVTDDPQTIAQVWKVRADAVGLLGQAVGGRRSIAFVEDCAVPPHRLVEFVAEFRSLLDEHGLSYGMFGHADVGCIHVRPALDLSDPQHEALVRTVSDGAAALVERFGGVLWGEHGRGFRGEYVGLSDDLVERMRRVKTAFDPRNVLNPGKLYAPLTDAPPIRRIDEVALRVHADRTVSGVERERFDSAFGCNGNGICHHWGDAEMMCPSFKVTLDPRLSPKGRADLTRAWLANPDDRRLADDVADSMRRCLSCGACTGRCPVGVDIPEIKSRFLERYRDPSRQRRVRTRVLRRFEVLLPTAQRAAPLTTVAQRVAAPLLRQIGIVDLPPVPAGTLATRAAALGVPVVSPSDDLGDVSVVVLPDAFSAFLDPSVFDATIRVLRELGERPAVGPFVPSGKLDHVTGRRTHFARAVARRRELTEGLAGRGAELVIVEPAMALLPDHEYRLTDSDYPASATTAVSAFIAERVDRLPGPPRDCGSVQLFGHCTETSLTPAATDAYRAMLEAVGYRVDAAATTCCGMAGVFGHEAEHQTMSQDLFDRSWRPLLDDSSFDRRCASGFSCRSQAKRFGFSDLRHPVELVAATLTPDR